MASGEGSHRSPRHARFAPKDPRLAQADDPRPGPERQEGAGPGRFQRAPDQGRRRSPTTAASGRPCRRSELRPRARGRASILVSHLGRPTGDPAADAPFRLDRVAARLQELLGRPVEEGRRHRRPRGPGRLRRARSRAASSCWRTSGSTRARRRATPRSPRQLAGLADAYVNDAFGTCHRDEASMVAVPEQLPARAAGDRLPGREGAADPRHPARPAQAADGRRDGRGQGLRQDPASSRTSCPRSTSC